MLEQQRQFLYRVEKAQKQMKLEHTQQQSQVFEQCSNNYQQPSQQSQQ